jgi:hypothetical protein
MRGVKTDIWSRVESGPGAGIKPRLRCMCGASMDNGGARRNRLGLFECPPCVAARQARAAARRSVEAEQRA